MATHSSVLAWRIPGTGESGGLLSKYTEFPVQKKKKKDLFDMVTNGENPEPSRFLFLVPHRPILVVRQGPWNVFQQSMQMKSALDSRVCPSDLGFR